MIVATPLLKKLRLLLCVTMALPAAWRGFPASAMDSTLAGNNASLEKSYEGISFLPSEVSIQSIESVADSTTLENFPLPVAISNDFTLSPSSESDNVFVRTAPNLFSPMLDFQNRQTDKELLLLRDVAERGHPSLLVGLQARLSALVAATNTDGKFNYQGRFPTDFEGSTATDARLVHANAAFAGHVHEWISVYGELLFSDVFSFPDHKQGSLQVRQAYVVFGNLCESPIYTFMGKKNVGFGDMSSLSPFSQSMVWHYFGALHEGLGVGYDDGRLNLTLTGLNGGRGIRASDSEAKGKINNFAANALFRSGDEQIGWQVGAGFLLGTIYDGVLPEHIDPNAFGEYNHAWDVNAQVRLGSLKIAGEFASTTNNWPATDHLVSAYRVEAAWEFDLNDRPAQLTASWSEGIQGESGSEFEFNRQLIIGFGVEVTPHALLSLEYIRGTGFAPLINITMVSDRNVVQDTALFGMTIAF